MNMVSMMVKVPRVLFSLFPSWRFTADIGGHRAFGRRLQAPGGTVSRRGKGGVMGGRGHNLMPKSSFSQCLWVIVVARSPPSGCGAVRWVVAIWGPIQALLGGCSPPLGARSVVEGQEGLLGAHTLLRKLVEAAQLPNRRLQLPQ